MILVTGGAGFIGSNIVAALNDVGRNDIAVCDRLDTGEKWRNLQKRQISDFVPLTDLARWLEGRALDAVIHMGANADTTASDGDAIMESNFKASLRLLNWCTENQVPLIYASSAATYGDGENGFSDELMFLEKLRPLNLYAWSKHLFDLELLSRRARSERLPPQCVGLKFFNVYGPNEYHKGEMKSTILRTFDRAKTGLAVKLFKSLREGVADGKQQRDFIYVGDVVSVVLWFLENPIKSGIFNVGTGKARTFLDMVLAVFTALDHEVKIEYIDMPEGLRDKYQYFTEAKIEKLRRVGYDKPFTSLEDGVEQYVTGFLSRDDRYR